MNEKYFPVACPFVPCSKRLYLQCRTAITCIRLQILVSLFILFSSAPAICQVSPANGWFSIKDFGAIGDGRTVDTKAINDAIEAASRQGGGTVLFPGGNYLSYSIHLKNNISLYLGEGCVLVAADSSSRGRYDEAEPNVADKFQDYGHSHWHNSLIWGENLDHVSILGPGIINGKGLIRNASERRPWGNKAIALKACRNVILRDFTILNGGHFGILATGVDNFTLDNLKMDTNRDGMDIDCCTNVRISNCTVNSPWDDAICLKSSYALGYMKATQNVTITNCQVSGFDLGTFHDGTYQRKEWNRVPDKQGPTGRIKFGTESNGGFINISISNCVFNYCRGLALETVDGATLEDIVIDNITMRDVTNAPLFLRLGARMRAPDAAVPGSLHRVKINNVNVYNADAHFASIIAGIPGHDVEDVAISNVSIYYLPIDSPQTRIQQTVPEFEKDYPEPQRFGVLPAYGFFIRHASNIRLSNIRLRLLGAESRPAFYLDNTRGLRFNDVEAQQGAAGFNYFLKETDDFILSGPGKKSGKKIRHTAASQW